MSNTFIMHLKLEHIPTPHTLSHISKMFTAYMLTIWLNVLKKNTYLYYMFYMFIQDKPDVNNNNRVNMDKP